MKFEDLGLSEPILSAIRDCGYESPTPIQMQAIPHVLMSRDVVGLAQTGTGKTAGFTLPMIEILHGGRAKARMPRSLILSPTRELASQIAENFDTYGKNCNLSKALLIGGTNMAEQIKVLERGADVLIATPGRLIDLFERGKILLNDIKILVIDEADRMLDMGFIPDIEKICALLPPIRQTLLFSATMAPEIKRLTTQFLTNPREVAVAPPASTAATVQQFIVHTHLKDKNDILEKVIQQESVETAFIFCNRKRDVDSLSKWLKNKGYKARPMHGDMAQASREQVLEQFKEGEVTLLVCSDVAGRGIDVDCITHVFNYDVPLNPDDYVHRIGRTGRAGQTGRAWMLVTKNDDKLLAAVFKRIGNEIEAVDVVAKGKKSENTHADDRPKGDKSKNNSFRGGAPNRNTDDKNIRRGVSSRHRSDDFEDNTEDMTGFGEEMPGFFKN